MNSILFAARFFYLFEPSTLFVYNSILFVLIPYTIRLLPEDIYHSHKSLKCTSDLFYLIKRRNEQGSNRTKLLVLNLIKLRHNRKIEEKGNLFRVFIWNMHFNLMILVTLLIGQLIYFTKLFEKRVKINLFLCFLFRVIETSPTKVTLTQLVTGKVLR
jgi:hypothetical protein